MAGEPIGDAKILLGVDTSGVDAGLAQAKAKVETAVAATESSASSSFTAGDASGPSVERQMEIEESIQQSVTARAETEKKVTEQVEKQVSGKKEQKRLDKEDSGGGFFSSSNRIASWLTGLGSAAASVKSIYEGMKGAAWAAADLANSMRSIERVFQTDTTQFFDGLSKRMEEVKKQQADLIRENERAHDVFNGFLGDLMLQPAEYTNTLAKIETEYWLARGRAIQAATREGKLQIAELQQEVRKFREELNKTNRFPSVAFDISKIAEFAHVLAKNVEASR